MKANSSLFIGIDLGTSGCRMVAVDSDGNNIASIRDDLPKSSIIDGHRCQQPEDWWQSVKRLFKMLLTQINPASVKTISVNGTSGTVLLIDINGVPLSPGYMYNDNANEKSTNKISSLAPENSGAHGSSSGLAKCLSLLDEHQNCDIYRCVNQADWIAGKLLECFDFSDENNSLKMGYDPVTRCWPEWMQSLNCLQYLPSKIYEPGTPIGTIAPTIAAKFGLNSDLQIIAGTTDSIAAFIATGSNQVGDAVTSLGSTLAIKLINDKPIFAPTFGVYSHRLGDTWLVGGASNSGGAAILSCLNQAEIDLLTPDLNPDQLTGLDYYPLPGKGERFPVYDPEMQPRLTPRPEDNRIYFQAILEGIARIEKQAYDKLKELGAVYPRQIVTMGGGSRNEAWREIREQFCQCPVINAEQSDAAYGSALLAKAGYEKTNINQTAVETDAC